MKSFGEEMQLGASLLLSGTDSGFEASLAAFDRALKLRPETSSTQWQRGLCLFYCRRYRQGSEQFTTNMTTHGSDVEEVCERNTRF